MLKNILKRQMEAVTTIPSWKEDPRCIGSYNNAAACESRTLGFKDLCEFNEKFQLAIPIGGHCLTWSIRNAGIGILIDRLEDDDFYVREATAFELGDIGPAAVPQLIESLKDDDPNARYWAAKALELIGTAAAENTNTVPQLGELLLQDDDPDVRMAAANALGSIGTEDAVPQLVTALKDTDTPARVREASAYALGSIGPVAAKNKDTVLQLGKTLKEDDMEVRSAAARALGRMGTKDAALKLRDAILADNDLLVRVVALDALQGILGCQK